MYIEPMSERLKREIKLKLRALGDQAVEKLAIEAHVSPSTVRKVRVGIPVSTKKTVVIALACGIDEEEALEIAKEHSTEAMRESA